MIFLRHQSVTFIRKCQRRIPNTAGCLHVSRHTLSTKTTNNGGGYQSFGSFHSDNVEELIRLPKDLYTPPELPFSTEDVTSFASASPPSSIPFANSHQYIPFYPYLDRQNWTFLNHGAFGLALDVGLRRANSWRTFLESQPLRYFDRYLLNHLVYSARGMVDFVTQGDEEDVASRIREGTALIQNVTSGMNAVIGGHARAHPNKFVFYYDIEYGSNKKMCQTYHGRENAIAIPFEEDYLPLLQKISTTTTLYDRKEGDWNPDCAEIFLMALDAAIHKIPREGGKASVAGSLLILDHITSNTAIHVPIASIAKYAKEEYGMIVAVDGAHALLGLPLDMGSILSDGNSESGYKEGSGHVDIYLTNAHKWFSSPRGAAMLFCANPEIRESILAQPAVVSHGVDDGFLSRFMWDGCRDYSAQLSLPAILDYWNTVGADTVRKEMQRNLKEGVQILISCWHPGIDQSCKEKHSAEAGLTLVPLEIHAPMLALVRLPDHISGRVTEHKTSTDAKRMQDFLYSQNVEVPIKCIRGVLYARVSCHVYNTVEEFERLARVINNLN